MAVPLRRNTSRHLLFSPCSATQVATANRFDIFRRHCLNQNGYGCCVITHEVDEISCKTKQTLWQLVFNLGERQGYFLKEATADLHTFGFLGFGPLDNFLGEATAEILTFGFLLSVWVFAKTLFFGEAIAGLHTFGFSPH